MEKVICVPTSPHKKWYNPLANASECQFLQLALLRNYLGFSWPEGSAL